MHAAKWRSCLRSLQPHKRRARTPTTCLSGADSEDGGDGPGDGEATAAERLTTALMQALSPEQQLQLLHQLGNAETLDPDALLSALTAISTTGSSGAAAAPDLDEAPPPPRKGPPPRPPPRRRPPAPPVPPAAAPPGGDSGARGPGPEVAASPDEERDSLPEGGRRALEAAGLLDAVPWDGRAAPRDASYGYYDAGDEGSDFELDGTPGVIL